MLLDHLHRVFDLLTVFNCVSDVEQMCSLEVFLLDGQANAASIASRWQSFRTFVSQLGCSS